MSRSLVRLAPPDQRGALAAAVLIALYQSFSLPSVIAGLAVTLSDLRTATLGYGVIVMLLASATAIAVSRRAGPDAPTA